MSKSKKTGSLEFNQSNGINFIVNNDPEADDEGSYELSWKVTPAAFAKELRKAADWLDKHAGDKINVDID